jgi:hypothetical protein
MSAVTELIDALISRGMAPAEAATLVARAGAEMNAVGQSKGAIRTRRWRENRASQSVTERHSVTPNETTTQTSQNVTERHKASHGDNALLLTSSSYQLTTEEKEKKVRGPKRARASPISADWKVPDRARALAVELSVDIKQTEDRFRDYLASSGKLYADYDAGFCNFIRNTPKFNGVPNGRQDDPKSALAAGRRQLERLGGMEAANAYVPGSSGPTPRGLDFGDEPASPKLISSR